MTTSTWSTVIDHSSDAGFRAWGGELSGKLSAAGLVPTTDTGTINWTTVTRPGVNAIAGYEIWNFADSSIYLKIEYGTGPSSGLPSIFLTVGTGSNGSGTITGQTNTRTAITRSTTIVAGSTAIARTSYLCVTDDYIGLCWKTNATSNSVAYGFFSVQKWSNTSGVAISTGFTCHYGASSGAVAAMMRIESVRTAATALTYGISSTFCLIPSGVTDSVVGSDNQVFLHFVPSPRVIPCKQVISAFHSEIALSTTFTATPVGATPHVFIGLNNQAGYSGTTTADQVGAAILWE